MSEVNGPNISVNQLNFSGIQKHSQEIPTENLEVEESANGDRMF